METLKLFEHLAVFKPYLIHAASDSTNGHQLSHFDRFRQIVKGTENVLDFVVKAKAEKLYTLVLELFMAVR